MVWEFNRRQPKPDNGKPGAPDDGAKPPTVEEQAAQRQRLRAIALPDERF